MLTDPISDMLTRIKNAYMAKKRVVVMPSSKLKVAIAEILKKTGYVQEFSIEGDKKKVLTVTLLYKDDKPAVEYVKRISKPGRRIYASAREIPKVLNGYGISIVSTSKGIMTNKEAKKENIGGEIICEIY